MVVSMDLYIKRKFSDYIAACEFELEKNENNNTLSILCNIASAEYELELYRKCIKTCHRALALNQNYIRAHLLLLKSLLKLDKDDICMTMCENILTGGEGRFELEDVNIVLQVQDLMDSVKSRSQRATTISLKDNMLSTRRSIEDVTPPFQLCVPESKTNCDAGTANPTCGSTINGSNISVTREVENLSTTENSEGVNLEISKCNTADYQNSDKIIAEDVNGDVHFRVQGLQKNVESTMLRESPSDSGSATNDLSPITAKVADRKSVV